MTVRNRALGRTRAAFAPTTLYIRGDVVSFSGALYAAKETFTSGATFVLANWDEVIPAPVIPTVSFVGLARNSVGAGLPSLVGRSNADQHYDTVSKQEYVRTGAPGAVVEDTFTRTAASLAGTTTEVGGLTWATPFGGFSLDGSAAVASTAGAPAEVNLGSASDGAVSIGHNFLRVAGEAVTLFMKGSSGGSSGWRFLARTTDGLGRLISPINSTVDGPVLDATRLPVGLHTISLEVSGLSASVYIDGSFYVSLTMPTGSTLSSGSIAGFLHNLVGGKVESFSSFAFGTLAWTSTDEFVATHAHPNLAQTDANTAAIRPSLLARANGDIYFSTDTGKVEIVTGFPATEFTIDINTNNFWTITGLAAGVNSDSFVVLGTSYVAAVWRFQVFFANGTSSNHDFIQATTGSFVIDPAGNTITFSGAAAWTRIIAYGRDGSAGTGSPSAPHLEIKAGGGEAWVEIPYASSSHAHAGRSGTASVSTVGAGLPAFTSRRQGDLHFDSAIGREFVLTGIDGASITDDFNGPDAASIVGRVTPTGNKTYEVAGTAGGVNAVISNNTLRGGDDLYGYAYINIGSGNQSVSIKARGVTFAGGGFVDAPHRVYLSSNIANPGTASTRHYIIEFAMSQARILRNLDGNTVTLATFNYPGGSEGLATVEYLYTAERVGSTINAYRNGVLVLTHTDTTPLDTTHVYAGVGVAPANHPNQNTDTNAYMDDLSITALGTLAWTPSEPIYLQAQLASGPVTTGTHVLKPGLRVPAASSLAEVVLRADTAPVGAAITVTVERFNNGTSAGIIATASIADGSTVGSVVGLNAAMAKGDILKFNITSVGSTTAGSDLTISLDAR